MADLSKFLNQITNNSNYLDTNCGRFCNQIRDVALKNIFNESVSITASEPSEKFQAGLNVYISHRNYHARPCLPDFVNVLPGSENAREVFG